MAKASMCRSAFQHGKAAMCRASDDLGEASVVCQTDHVELRLFIDPA